MLVSGALVYAKYISASSFYKHERCHTQLVELLACNIFKICLQVATHRSKAVYMKTWGAINYTTVQHLANLPGKAILESKLHSHL